MVPFGWEPRSRHDRSEEIIVGLRARVLPLGDRSKRIALLLSAVTAAPLVFAMSGSEAASSRRLERTAAAPVKESTDSPVAGDSDSRSDRERGTEVERTGAATPSPEPASDVDDIRSTSESRATASALQSTATTESSELPTPPPIVPAPTVPAPTAAAPPAPPPAPAPPPPAAVSIDGRPYSASSAWNTPLAAGAASDPNSPGMIATLGQHNGGAITSDHTQYTFPVYFADANTPRYDVPCTTYRCTVVSPAGTSTTDLLRAVPIPQGARPTEGSDAQIIVIDRDTGTEYDLWQVSGGEGGWSVSNGSVYNIYWDGMPTQYGSRGAGVPYYAGLIRPWEIAAGHIDHALAFAYPGSASRGCVWPASKTDGDSGDSMAIPEGARLQLDPSLTDAHFDQWGLDRTGRIIARALQQYGMILIDVSGRPKIYAEDPSVNPYAGASWSDPNILLTSTTIASIPHTAYRVLDLPDAYWAGGGPTHGDCYR